MISLDDALDRAEIGGDILDVTAIDPPRALGRLRANVASERHRILDGLGGQSETQPRWQTQLDVWNMISRHPNAETLHLSKRSLLDTRSAERRGGRVGELSSIDAQLAAKAQQTRSGEREQRYSPTQRVSQRCFEAVHPEDDEPGKECTQPQ